MENYAYWLAECRRTVAAWGFAEYTLTDEQFEALITRAYGLLLPCPDSATERDRVTALVFVGMPVREAVLA